GHAAVAATGEAVALTALVAGADERRQGFLGREHPRDQVAQRRAVGTGAVLVGHVRADVGRRRLGRGRLDRPATGVAATARVRTAGEAGVVAEVEQRLTGGEVVVVDRVVLAESERRAQLRLDGGARLVGGQLDRLDVGDQVVDLLGGVRAVTAGTPAGHRRPRT